MCVLFSGNATYKIGELILLEKEVLCCFLHFPSMLQIMYLGGCLPPLLTRFQILTVQTFLKIYNSPLRHAPHIFIQKPSSFFGTQWSSLHLAQIVFVQALLEPLNVNTYITLTSMLNSKLHIELNDIFPTNAKQMPLRYLNNQLRDYLLLSP